MHIDKMTQRTSGLSDDALTAELARLVACERGATAAVIAHLAEFAARGLHLAAGFPSLFAYCTEALRLSEHEAYNRIEAARLAVRFPEVLHRVRDGSLNLTAVRLLAPHLTEDNKERLLAEASYKSKREVEEAIVRYAPRPEVPASIRKVPVAKATTSVRALLDAVTVGSGEAGDGLRGDGVPEDGTPEDGTPEDGTPAGDMQGRGVSGHGMAAQRSRPSAADDAGTPGVAAPAGRPAIVRPLAVDRYEIRFTATSQTRDKLRLATDLLRHAVPDGDMAEVIDRALDALLEQLARQKFAAVQDRRSPGTKSPAPGDRSRSHTRYIPAAVKRAVWLRDGGRCAFVSNGLRRCKERGRLEFHHLRPYAAGGTATVDNIQIRCRAHNVFEAELFFGGREPECAAVGSSVGNNGRPIADSFQTELADPAARPV